MDFSSETFLRRKTEKDLARVGDKACDHLTGGGKADVLPGESQCFDPKSLLKVFNQICSFILII